MAINRIIRIGIPLLGPVGYEFERHEIMEL
jgi:hypothetical protein